MTTTITRKFAAVLAALALTALVLAGCDWRGPNPTLESLQADTGPFDTAEVPVTAGNGYGGGTIYHPTGTEEGPFGAVVVIPGFLSPSWIMAAWGPRLASHGFVVHIIDTLSGFDQPPARGDQALAALDWLTTASPVAAQTDPNRRAVMGWSMGGGGSLEAAADDPTLRAIIPLAPWNPTTDWSGLTVPTMVVGCEADAIAPVATHAEPFYESLAPDLARAYVEIDDADHFCVGSPTDTLAVATVAWLKRFVDGDSRYNQFLCPPAPAPDLSEYRESCPH